MNDTTAAFAVLAGLAVRLAVPILVTALAVLALRQLDARWRFEAHNQPLQVEKPKCWKIEGCSPSKRKDCAGFKSPLPCWQVFRLPSGYLNEKCLACPVFVKAPLPAQA
jgi:hypothetical protein